MTQLSMLNPKTQNYIDFAHLPMFCGYGREDLFRKCLCPVVSYGINPSGNDINSKLHGTDCSNLVEQLFGFWGEDMEKTLEVAEQIKNRASAYFEQVGQVHNYFRYECFT